MEAIAQDRIAPHRTRGEWRMLLLDRIETAAPMLEQEALPSEQQQRLSETAVEFLRDQDLLKLKLPEECGGANLDNAVQFEVYEKLAYYNSAAAWCAFIYTDILGLLGAKLSDAGLARICQDGLPLVCGGGGRVMGKLEKAEGGWNVSGQWTYGSGLDGSDWVAVMAADPADPSTPMMCVVNSAEARSLRNWNVMGLSGTGSADFAIDGAFVPDELTFPLVQPSLRGGPNAMLGVAGLIGHTVPAVALGLARRSLDDLVALARHKARGYMVRQTIGDRPAFQAFISTADLRLKAARQMMLENGLRLADATAASGYCPGVEAEVRAAGTWVTEQALQIASDVIRWAGGEAVRSGNRFERALRDIQVASTHYCINNTSYEHHGQWMLGKADIALDA